MSQFSFRSMTSLLLALFVSACAHKTPAGDAPPSTILTGARVIDGSGSAPFENATIIIRDGRIAAIQDAAAPLPTNGTLIDMQGKTIMPTLIAAHTHLGLTFEDQAGSANLNEKNVLHQLEKFMSYGVGAVLSLGTDHEFIYKLREQRQKNQIVTPWILTAGRGFGMTDGAPPASMGLDEVYRPTSVAEVKKDMEELVAHHPDLVKVWVDDFAHAMKGKMDPTLYKAVIQEAHHHSLKVAAHVYYLADAKQLAKDGVDIFAHSIRDLPVDAEMISLIKEHNIAYIPTLALDESQFVYADNPTWMQSPFFRDALDHGVWTWMHSEHYKPKEASRQDFAIAKQNALTLLKAGVRIGFGTDSGATLSRIQGFGEHHELELLVAAGFTPMQALRSATAVNAAMLGLADQMGTLSAGKKADLLILNDNPLDNISNTQKINSVWLDGVRVSKGP